MCIVICVCLQTNSGKECFVSRNWNWARTYLNNLCSSCFFCVIPAVAFYNMSVTIITHNFNVCYDFNFERFIS